MVIIPAIDIKLGKCVRLRQGRMDSSTVFNESPSEQARQWEAGGAKRIHVVDLDGSIEGRPVNLEEIRRIVESVAVPVQLGGGIRRADTIRSYLDIGVSTVILGTIAAREPDLVLGLLDEFPGRIAVGIDAKDGWVAVEGWTRATGISAGDLAGKLAPGMPVSFIYTDIERDGMMSGPNIDATRRFALGTNVPVVLSGGISCMDDVRGAMSLEGAGVAGIIIGRALYEGTVALTEAIALTES
ncbi:MAG: 1-(5-phosphoribosyl)-5-[(5-phosphoribosylamino)methylideneamino]imidazole-4-carboxamide isomerase [Pseudomonadota bacterium]